MPLHRLTEPLPTLERPVLIASFDGWVDAAQAGSEAVGHLAAGADLIADFDTDAIYDYRSRRPVLDVLDGRLSELRWPQLAIHHTRMAERDLLVFAGAEPDLRWRALADDVVGLLRQLGVTQWISLGAVPAAVPHTLAVPVMATESDDGLLHKDTARGPEGLLRVPSAALSAVEMAVSAAGIPAVGFFAQVPPYASIGYTAASIALLDRLSRHIGVTFDLGDLVEQEQEQRARYDAAVAADAGLRETVAQLESMAGSDGEEQLPTGDELAREIQRFLRSQPGEEEDA